MELHQSEQTQQSAEKVIATVFWDSSGILFFDYLKNEKNQHRLLLCVIEPIEKRNHKKTASFVEEKTHLFARQCNSSQIGKNDGTNQ